MSAFGRPVKLGEDSPFGGVVTAPSSEYSEGTSGVRIGFGGGVRLCKGCFTSSYNSLSTTGAFLRKKSWEKFGVEVRKKQRGKDRKTKGRKEGR